MCICNCSLKHFYHGCFKIFGNSKFSIIFVLASVFFFFFPFSFKFSWFFVQHVVISWNLDIWGAIMRLQTLLQSVFDYGFLWLQGKERRSLLIARFLRSGSFYTRSGIPWYWAEMCLPAPHCVFADILWEAPPYCSLSGHRWHHSDRGSDLTSPGKWQKAFLCAVALLTAL